MSSPHDFFREGRLNEAIEAQIAAVKAAPTNADERLLLFVLLCFRGDLERALIHLDTLVTLEGETRGGASVYHALVAAEYERVSVFSSGGDPTVAPGDFPGVSARLDAIRAIRRNDLDSACAAIDRANDAATEQPGKLNGEAFTSLCDYDDLLGDVLEVYAGGRYMWLPFAEIERITITEPGHYLDLLWIPAEIERRGGETSNVHLPTLYPRTHESHDDQVKLGRSTEWIEIGAEIFRGTGQKIFFGTRGDETFDRPLLETRVVEFTSSPNRPD